MDQTKTITLKQPVEYGSETVTEIKLRPPLGRDLRRLDLRTIADTMTVDMLLDLAADLSGHAPELMDRLGKDDTYEICGAVADFLR